MDTDGDGVIDEQEIRIEYLNRELFVETVMNDGDRVSGRCLLPGPFNSTIVRSTSDRLTVISQYCLFTS